MSLKFSALSTNLIPALATVGRIVPSRSTLPIVQNVLIECDEGMIRISGTDLNASIRTKIGAMIEEDGSIAIPFRPLYELVRSFPEDRIDIEVVESDDEKDTNCVIIKSGHHTGRLNTAKAQDFPPTEVSGEGLELSFPASQLEQSISKVKFSTATEESRPVLKGIHIKASAEKQSITFVAADGFRLSVCEMEVTENIPEDIKITVPRETMEEVERLCGRTQGNITVTIQHDKGQVRFKNESTTIISQILQGEFPNYEQLIPNEYNTKLSIDKKQFAQGINAAAALTRNDNSIARFFVTTGTPTMGQTGDEDTNQSEDNEIQAGDDTTDDTDDEADYQAGNEANDEADDEDGNQADAEDDDAEDDDAEDDDAEDDEASDEPDDQAGDEDGDEAGDEPDGQASTQASLESGTEEGAQASLESGTKEGGEPANKEQKGEKQERYITIKAQGADVGDYSTRIDVTEYAGTDNRVAINIRYLSDLDRQIKDDIIVMEITNQGSPVAFRSNKGSDVHVIMPMSVKWA